FGETDTHGSLQIRATSITGHNHYRILEVHGATLTISQTSIIHNLQQGIEDLWMGLLYLVQKNDAIGTTPYLLRQLTTLIMTNVTRGATEQTRHSMWLHILRHIKTDQITLTTKQFSRQSLRQFGLTYTSRTKEQERTNRTFRILQTCTRTTNSTRHCTDSLILTD